MAHTGGVDIGSASFARPVTDADKAEYHKRFNREMPEHIALIGVSVKGATRVCLLRAAFRGEVLPGGLVLVRNQAGGPHNMPITRDDVQWNVVGEGSNYGRVVDGIWEVRR